MSAPDSISAPLPKGWTAELFDSLGTTYRRAIDPDGCRWYWTDGEWVLNVPYFRASRPGLDQDDIALVEHVSGEALPCPVDGAGVIRIGRRRIPSQHWNH